MFVTLRTQLPMLLLAGRAHNALACGDAVSRPVSTLHSVVQRTHRCCWQACWLWRRSLRIPVAVLHCTPQHTHSHPHKTNTQLQLLLASLLAVATQLEDPFASPHPDALSVWEARDGVAYVSMLHALLL